ncbi:MAG: sulfite exporter TauE/SafE family protein [Candidatus Aminicenantes bacterium]|nr:sulfite exporter TauE/SafE family protein [Candidatus Aminicenantes bacterium]
MDSGLIYSLVVLVLFSAAFLRSAVGFGDAVLAMPFLAVLVGVRTATPLVAFCASSIAFFILVGNWRKADWRATLHLILATLAGIPFGLFFITRLSEDILKTALGALILVYGAYRLFRPNIKKLGSSLPPAYAFGFAAGMLGGAYNTNGPPIVVYGTMRRWDPEHFRATLQGYFLPTGLFILAGHGVSGLWTFRVLKLYLLAVPFVLLGVYLGGKLNRSLPLKLFEKWINIVLIALGILLVVRTVFIQY